MSIADKITSIEEHLADDYEALENLGADLTNVNKNIQNIRTCLDNIYSNIPKTTGEGSNLSLSTIKGRINVDDILGDTEQDTTTGKNILDISLIKSGFDNYVTFNDDDSITINCDNSSGSSQKSPGGQFLIPSNISLSVGEKYYIVCEILKIGSNNTNTNTLVLDNAYGSQNRPFTGVIVAELILGTTTYLKEVENASPYDYFIRAYMNVPAGKISSLTFRISIVREADISNYTYEPFTRWNSFTKPNLSTRYKRGNWYSGSCSAK